MLWVRCLSCPVCLSVTFVHCSQTVGLIETKLGMQLGFGSDHIVLVEDTVTLLKGVDVRISKLDLMCGALPVVALKQQIIVVKTRSESV